MPEWLICKDLESNIAYIKIENLQCSEVSSICEGAIQF